MSFTQPVCGECYAQKEPGRQPFVMKQAFRESVRCCFCGTLTREGIWYRADPKAVPYPHKEPGE